MNNNGSCERLESHVIESGSVVFVKYGKRVQKFPTEAEADEFISEQEKHQINSEDENN